MEKAFFLFSTCLLVGVAVCAPVDGNGAEGRLQDRKTVAAETTTATSGVLSPSWFLEDGSFVRNREEKVAVLSPDNFIKLQRLIGELNMLRADMATLERLSSEAAAAIREMDARLANENGMRKDGRYSYKSKEEAIAALNVFKTVLTGRREACRAVLAIMQADFNLSLDRAYRLESETRSIFAQSVAASTSGTTASQELAADNAALAKAEEEREAAEEAYKTALESAVKRLESSTLAELESARKNLAGALGVKTKADAELEEAARNLAWAKDNRRKDLVLQYKKLVADAEHSVDAAMEGVSAAQKQVSRVERAMSRIAEIAEAEVKTFKKEAERKIHAAEKARAEAERQARAEAEAKAAEEKRARVEAERRARDEAEAKAAEEKRARVEAERRARDEAEAKAEAERKAAADEEEKAIAAEKALLDSRAQAMSAKYAAEYATAVGAFNAADAKVIEARRAVAAARAKYDKIRGDKASTKAQKDAARAGIVFAENQLNSAENGYIKAQRAVTEVQDAISRIEKDVRRAYADELRAQGRKPLTYSTGFLGI